MSRWAMRQDGLVSLGTMRALLLSTNIAAAWYVTLGALSTIL